MFQPKKEMCLQQSFLAGSFYKVGAKDQVIYWSKKSDMRAEACLEKKKFCGFGLSFSTPLIHGDQIEPGVGCGIFRMVHIWSWISSGLSQNTSECSWYQWYWNASLDPCPAGSWWSSLSQMLMWFSILLLFIVQCSYFLLAFEMCIWNKCFSYFHTSAYKLYTTFKCAVSVSPNHKQLLRIFHFTRIIKNSYKWPLHWKWKMGGIFPVVLFKT